MIIIIYVASVAGILIKFHHKLLVIKLYIFAARHKYDTEMTV